MEKSSGIIAVVLTLFMVVVFYTYYRNMLKYRIEIIRLRTQLNEYNESIDKAVKAKLETVTDDFPIKEGDVWAYKTSTGTIMFTGIIKYVDRNTGAVGYYSSIGHSEGIYLTRDIVDFLNLFNTKLA